MSNETPQPVHSSSCRKGYYPYPAENVFLVAGVKVGDGAPDFSRSASMVVVSRKAELAAALFIDLMPTPEEYASAAYVSLATLRSARARLAEGAPNPKRLAEGPLAFVLGGRQSWAIFFADEVARDPFEIVSASSSKTVFEHAKQTGRPIAGILRTALLDPLIEQLTATREGKCSNERYAFDYDSGEMAERAKEIMAAQPQRVAEFVADLDRAREKRRLGLID